MARYFFFSPRALMTTSFFYAYVLPILYRELCFRFRLLVYANIALVNQRLVLCFLRRTRLLRLRGSLPAPQYVQTAVSILRRATKPKHGAKKKACALDIAILELRKGKLQRSEQSSEVQPQLVAYTACWMMKRLLAASPMHYSSYSLISTKET